MVTSKSPVRIARRYPRLGSWALTGALVLGACAPVIEYRGYKLDLKDVERVTVGTEKQTVQDILGSPSTVATIDAQTWFYISSTVRKYLFYRPEETDRTVVAIFFDADKKVEEVAYYGIEDGQIINLVDRITPTSGKRLSILGEIFGNLGRFNRPVNQGAPNRPGQ